MKKNVILVMLLLAGAGSMTGQEISEDPIMVVTGNVVNTGVLIAKGPIDLRANAGKNSKIDNTATGDIQTPALTVGSNTELNNEGNICVGCVSTPATPAWPAALLLTGVARDYSDGNAGDQAKFWTTTTNSALSGSAYSSWQSWQTGGTAPAIKKNLMVSRYVYSSNAKVESTTAGRNYFTFTAEVSLSTLSSGISWADAVTKCADLEEGGYTDWYLPNSMEMDALVDARLLGYSNISSRTNLFYWSSTEYDATRAWYRHFDTGSGSGTNATNKTNAALANATWVARCVRRN